MSTLLVSLGHSPAVVPEAFLLPGVDFTAVHVLTTASVKDEDIQIVIDWFCINEPDVDLSVTQVAGFTEFKSEADHFEFEEVLYRWWLGKAGNVPPHVCLSGGFKTMSTAMQKAASMFGAVDLFHVLCDRPEQPKSGEDIDLALRGGHLHWIKLGEESGWPQLHRVCAAEFPLTTEKCDGLVASVSSPNHAFRKHLSELLERSHNVSGAWSRIGQLPFPALATWSAAQLAWLDEPVDPEADRLWIAALPKVELHCHLGGFATHGELLQQVRSAACPITCGTTPLQIPTSPPGWPLPADPISLADYMRQGNANGSALLSDPACLAEQCRLLYDHLLEEKVVYAEIRCSPANYTSPARSPWTVLTEIKAAFDSGMAERPGCHVNLIIIATRRETGDYRAAISRHLALAVTAAEHWTGDGECRVVGVDLAGYEDETTRAHYFREEFTAIHRCGIALTVHAGENDDAEGIWRAVFDLNARRLGHALHLRDSPELMQSVADRGIGVEMCPYANYQIKGYPLPPDGNASAAYPLKYYLDRGIKVTVNTDNIGISAASITDNLILAARLCPTLTRLDLLRLLRHSAEVAFIPPAARRRILDCIQSRMTSTHSSNPGP